MMVSMRNALDVLYPGQIPAMEEVGALMAHPLVATWLCMSLPKKCQDEVKEYGEVC